MVTLQQLSVLKIEYQRRQQIFDESIAIMQKTNNPDVLMRRYSELTDFVDWFFAQKEKGLPLKADKTKEQMNSDIPAFFNYHSVRIANYIIEHTPKKEHHNFLVLLLSSLKECRNKEESYIKISELINKDICNYTITQSFTERLEHIRVSRSNKRVTKSKKRTARPMMNLSFQPCGFQRN